MKIIQVYAPTSVADDKEMEEFYNMLQTALNEDICKYTLIIGDFNAKIGSKERSDGEGIGMYGYGERNERGRDLLEFVEGNRLYIMNSFYQKPTEKKWTWISPDGQTKNEIDLILSNKKRIINDVEVDEELDIGSDHRAVKVKLKIKGEKLNWFKKRNYKQRNNKLKENANCTEYEIALIKEIEEKRLFECGENLDEYERILRNAIKNATIRTNEGNIEPVSDKKMPKEIKRLMEKRRRLKRKNRDRIERAELSKLIRSKLKEWSDKKRIDQLNGIIEKGGSLRKYWKSQSLGKGKIVGMKNKEGNIMKEKKEIVDIITEFYDELYKKSSDQIGNKSKEEYININGKNYEANEETSGAAREELPVITKDEIERVIKRMKRGKAGGKDGITCEELKAGGETMVRAIQKLFNLCIKYKNVPKEWYEAQLILLFKKGDKHNIENYRPLSLLSAVYKMFMSVISFRIEQELERDIDETQTGFRKNRSTLDNIFVVKQMISRAYEYNFPLVLVYVDFKKAFDSILKEYVIGSLKESGIHDTYIRIFENIYEEATLNVKVENEERHVRVRRGVRQGDVLSGKIFIKVLEKVCNQLDWDGKGIRVNGRYVNILKFADDVIILSQSYEQAEEMLGQLIVEARKIGLEINLGKTKVMSNLKECKNVIVENNRIEEVEEYVYLGSLINIKDKRNEKEIERRIGLAWRGFNKYRYLFRSDVNMEAKRKLWNTCILPIMVYGCETWTMTERVIKKMRVAQRRMERSMLKISRREKKTNKWVRSETKLGDIGEIMTERKWNWCGHIIRAKDERLTKEMMGWYPIDRIRKRGRPGIRWDEEMRKIIDRKSLWQRVAYDRNEWRRMGQVYCKVYLYAN